MDASPDAPAEALPLAAYLRAVAERLERGQDGAEAVVVGRGGSAPSTPGQRIYLGADGRVFGTVGGGAIERAVLGELAPIAAAARTSSPRLVEHRLGPELAMCCGGRVTLLLAPLPAKLPVLLVGGGHVGAATAPLLATLDFAVTLIDARDGFAEPGRFPGVTSRTGDYDDLDGELPAEALVLTMTHDHALDQEVVAWAIARGAPFVGGVGSRAKAEKTRARLRAKGVPDDVCARVEMPVGAPIGARTPAEIAVAIAARLVAYRAGLGGGR